MYRVFLLYISLTLLYVCVFGQCLSGVNLKVQFALRLPRYLWRVHVLGVNWTSISVRY